MSTKKRLKVHIALHGNHLRATGHHLPYGVRVLPATHHKWMCPALTLASQAGTQFTYPRGMEGWVDLGSLIAARPGIKPINTWSQVRRPNHYATKPPQLLWLRGFRCKVFTGRMPFLSPNQQRQSTEGTLVMRTWSSSLMTFNSNNVVTLQCIDVVGRQDWHPDWKTFSMKSNKQCTQIMLCTYKSNSTEHTSYWLHLTVAKCTWHPCGCHHETASEISCCQTPMHQLSCQSSCCYWWSLPAMQPTPASQRSLLPLGRNTYKTDTNGTGNWTEIC